MYESRLINKHFWFESRFIFQQQETLSNYCLTLLNLSEKLVPQISLTSTVAICLLKPYAKMKVGKSSKVLV
jgi:hypothetical protein